jgi:hypothetical protein
VTPATPWASRRTEPIALTHVAAGNDERGPHVVITGRANGRVETRWIEEDPATRVIRIGVSAPVGAVAGEHAEPFAGRIPFAAPTHMPMATWSVQVVSADSRAVLGSALWWRTF